MSEVRCYRCGKVAEVEWFDITTLGGVRAQTPNRAWCVTEGCVDEVGRRQPFAPPTLEEIHRHADKVWLDRQMRLVEERG